ncbi:hypothetical protein [Holdemania sp. 1001302B_160321_E10]|uniref:hypothetical protein n=1 Tax=Holdemania sp. 1001302B_160321_E10 TaxID=2787120 RepID=UPI001896F387|nr:hypothetical protein [Holdemania sp. 1001302B_160321_E10]
MNNKKTMLYLAGFFVSQLVLVVAVFGVRKEMAIVQIFIILSLAIAITLVGDFCIFGIIRSVMRYNEEELELRQLTELNRRNYQFYQFAVMQQQNIRYFYHDLSNHLITLEILKEQGKTEELNAYANKLMTQFDRQLPAYKTGNVMLDILIQYNQIHEPACPLTVRGPVPEQFDFSALLRVMQKLAEICPGTPVTLRFEPTLRVEVPAAELARKQKEIETLRQENKTLEIIGVME